MKHHILIISQDTHILIVIFTTNQTILTLTNPGTLINALHLSNRIDTSLLILTWINSGVPSSNLFATGVKRFVPVLPITLNQWLTETQGKEERESCYKPMKDALIEHFSDIPPEKRCISLHL